MSAFSQKLTQKQLQTMSLSYGMKLSLQLLQLNSLQLKEFLEKELMDNPMFEVEMPMQYTSFTEQGTWDIPDESKSLQEELMLQIQDARCNFAIIEELLHQCDRNGYLLATKEELAKQLHTSVQEIQYHLSLIHHCEPYGIASSDLSECLAIQLSIRYPQETLAYELVQHHLEDIAKHRLEKLAQCYHVHKEDIHQAILLIQTLDPRPAICYDLEHVVFVKPDILLERDGEELMIVMPHYFTIQEQDFYKTKSLSKEELAYIKEKQTQGRAILECLQHRKQTLHAIMQVMIETQKEFVLQRGHRQYLIMKDIGEQLSLHETTISRAMKDKCFEFEGVVYPMHALLCKQVHDTSVDEIRSLLATWIAQESAQEPLSDQTLSTLLKEKGIQCSRRTIAKYRMEQHIPSTHTRKRQKETRHE